MFDIQGKVALISGGASGIGLQYAKELLRNGLKGVTLADVNEEFGKKALNEIKSEFGSDTAIFVKTDVSNYQSYEEAFKQTIIQFENLDILINNAGICNDVTWEKEIAVNFNGVVHGMLLGLENYIPKYKSGSEGVIVNASSIAGVEAFPTVPIYSATKFGVLGMSKAFGNKYHYKATNIKVLAICPGVTDTPLVVQCVNNTLGPRYKKLLDKSLDILPSQSPEFMAAGLIKVIQNAKSGTAWVVEGNQEPYEYVLARREDLAPK